MSKNYNRSRPCLIFGRLCCALLHRSMERSIACITLLALYLRAIRRYVSDVDEYCSIATGQNILMTPRSCHHSLSSSGAFSVAFDARVTLQIAFPIFYTIICAVPTAYSCQLSADVLRDALRKGRNELAKVALRERSVVAGHALAAGTVRPTTIVTSNLAKCSRVCFDVIFHDATNFKLFCACVWQV